MPNTRPLVAAAYACENILEEKDGVLSSIRLVDTYLVTPRANVPPGTVPAIEMRVLISLKSGDVTGVRDVGVVVRSPTGKSAELHRGQAVFRGGEHGINLRIRFGMPVTALGLHWIDVLVDEEVLTSIPIKLAEAPVEEPRPSATGESQSVAQ